MRFKLAALLCVALAAPAAWSDLTYQVLPGLNTAYVGEGPGGPYAYGNSTVTWTATRWTPGGGYESAGAGSYAGGGYHSRMLGIQDGKPVYWDSLDTSVSLQLGAYTTGMAMSSNGTHFAGYVADNSGNYRPAIWNGTSLAVVGTGAPDYSFLNAINTSGLAIGTSYATWEGFTLSASGTYTSLAHAAAGSMELAYGINDAGTAVGLSIIGNTQYGAIWKDGAIQTVLAPNSTLTSFYGLIGDIAYGQKLTTVNGLWYNQPTLYNVTTGTWIDTPILTDGQGNVLGGYFVSAASPYLYGGVSDNGGFIAMCERAVPGPAAVLPVALGLLANRFNRRRRR